MALVPVQEGFGVEQDMSEVGGVSGSKMACSSDVGGRPKQAAPSREDDHLDLTKAIGRGPQTLRLVRAQKDRSSW